MYSFFLAILYEPKTKAQYNFLPLSWSIQSFRETVSSSVATMRGVRAVVESKWQSEGRGARVRRSIGRPELRNLDPFLMLDEFEGSRKEGAGFPDHPHRQVTWGYSYLWQPDFPQKLIKTRSYSTFSDFYGQPLNRVTRSLSVGPSGPAVGFGQFILGQSHVVHVGSLASKSESIKATTFSSGGSKL